jgi:hypothetical protein
MLIWGESRWREICYPARKPLKAAGTFISENLTAAKNFAQYVAPEEFDSWDELEPGEGAIVRKGVRKIAAYRDETGNPLLRSVACLGRHLHWTVSNAAGTARARKNRRIVETMKRKTGRRELIAPRGDQRHIRGDAKGRIREGDDQSKSLSQAPKGKDRIQTGQGDRGDRKTASSSKQAAR